MSNIFSTIINKYIQYKSPVKFAKKMGVVFGTNFSIYGEVEWGSEPWIITIGNDVVITHRVQFLTHDGGALLFRNEIPDLEKTMPINVGNRVFIGTKSIIMGGVTIGDNVVIAAGSVVTKSIPANSVYGGNPAHFIETFEDYKLKLIKNSLHLGNYVGKEKDEKLREYFGKTRK